MSAASDARWMWTLEDYVLRMESESQDWRVRQLVYAVARQIRSHRSRRNALRKARRVAKGAKP